MVGGILPGTQAATMMGRATSVHPVTEDTTEAEDTTAARGHTMATTPAPSAPHAIGTHAVAEIILRTITAQVTTVHTITARTAAVLPAAGIVMSGLSAGVSARRLGVLAVAQVANAVTPTETNSTAIAAATKTCPRATTPKSGTKTGATTLVS